MLQCKVDGGNYYNNSGQDVVAANGQVLSAGGCYQAETCASSPFPDVIDQVARWSCRNDAFLDAAQDAAVAVAVVAGVIVLAPVSAGVVLAGAGVGLVLSPWTCDQSDNGWYAPATSFSDVSSSCVATEVSLGAIFAPIGGTGATATLGRAIAVGCVEGGTSTAVYGYQNPETEIDPGNVAIGTALGCATGGVVHAGVQRVSARGLSSQVAQNLKGKADSIRVELQGSPFAIGGNRNVAVAEYWISGQTAELIGAGGQARRPGTVNPPTQPVFAAFDFDWDRSLDAEYKILEEIAARLGPARPLSGVVHIYSELPICASCGSVIEQFQDRYGVEVIIGIGR